MPTNLPSSFASAAAGQSRGSRSGREGGGSGEWTRREGRSTNGTLTFRRSSTTPFNQSQPTSDLPTDGPTADVVPPQSVASALSDGTHRYSRDQLLDISRSLGGHTSLDVGGLFMNGWNPGHVNGRVSWAKNEGHVPLPLDHGLCWDANGRVKPMGWQEMTDEEREAFSGDVNSPLKPQQKEGNQPGGINGRKASISHGSNYGLSSPSTASRPSTRRRETTDSNPYPGGGLTSPTGTGRFREESSWFGRKSIDAKDSAYEDDEEANPPSAKPTGFGGLMRSNTAGSTSFGTAASLWGGGGAGAAAAPPTPSTAVGSFGSFAMSPTVGDKRFGSTRGESRLAHLLPKDSSESMSKATESSGSDMKTSWRSRARTDTDPFADDDGLSGSAALGGGQDSSPPPMPPMPQSHHAHPYDTPLKGSAGDFGMSGLQLAGNPEDNSTGTPETNPYRSPGEHGDDEQGQGGHVKSQGGIPPENVVGYGSLPRGFAGNTFDAGDRSQTSSAGGKGFPALNTLGGWPSALNTGTPDREQSAFGGAFGSSIFSPVGDLQSPSFAGMPGVFGHGSVGGLGQTGSLRGSSKMGSLFPAAMQAQMHQSQEPEGLGDSFADVRQANPLGAIGRSVARSQATDPEGILSGRTLFDEALAPGPYSVGEQSQSSAGATVASQQQFDSGPRTETPMNAPRIMVMPDRMRWVYLDPQGHVQGPFTGLEMNDWYKANFFTPDLRVKKSEDPEFEPLGQLIRRIGNSREPFLVPQMGVAHGPPSQTGAFTHGDRGGVIPPLMGAFPSFGRTLTAEEQNNLERRKQEEQFMMARQREMMAAQHHPFSKLQMAPGGGVLHHHSSAHSLQSQPSFGSMTSPLAGQPPIGGIGSTAAFFEQSQGPSSAQPALIPTQDLLHDDLNAEERHMLAALQASAGPTGFLSSQAAGESSLRSHLPGIDELQKDSQGFSERLKEFRELQAEREAVDAVRASMEPVTEEPIADAEIRAALAQAEAAQIIDEVTGEMQEESQRVAQARQVLSLTQQVQKTQAKEQPQVEDVWNKPSSDMPMPFPPPQPQSTTPLPAPTAQRTRSTLPDQYAASRSQSETPDSANAGSATAQAPTLAPWAREPGDGHRGPSLKEIQEAEAKKAAKAEQVAAAARRVAAEQEAILLREREKAGVIAAPPGLPMSSTWGNGSPVTPTSASPWAKSTAVKSAAPGLSAGPVSQGNEKKKTLADIQREEEVRKQKNKEIALQSGAAPASSMGKRYADLASKSQGPGLANHAAAAIAGQPGPSAPGGWATVGAGGKVKVPTGPAATRTVSTGNVKPAATAAPPRPVIRQSASTVGKMDAGGAALTEFNKWLHRELARGINGIVDINAFASTLLELPLDQTIISDAVYGSSKTMDGRHFAEEFVRRKKLADKGVVEKQPPTPASATDKSGGGWSEVAKKGGSTQKEESVPAGFKVVPGRKKGKK